MRRITRWRNGILTVSRLDKEHLVLGQINGRLQLVHPFRRTIHQQGHDVEGVAALFEEEPAYEAIVDAPAPPDA